MSTEASLRPAVNADVSMRSRMSQLPWLFSPAWDLAAFGGSALVSLLLLALGWHWNLLDEDSPEWTWITLVVLVDVAHVYATAFRTYFDPAELRRRPWLYTLTPLLGWMIGFALYTEGPEVFWRALAYLAVFHFVRQQYGWVALYRARAGERDRLGWWIDAAAIYLATLYPLLYWHTHLPRNFWWFLRGDFATLTVDLTSYLAPIYWLSLAVYAGRSLVRGAIHGLWNPGKDLVVTTTALCWHLGIITFNSDYAFTVTNVVIHGVPYMVLVFWHGERGSQEAPSPAARRAARWIRYLATLWLLAIVEELCWDRGVWHERGWLFGSAVDLEPWKLALVPLLAVPQLTHYILDGFLWRRRKNPSVEQLAQPQAKV